MNRNMRKQLYNVHTLYVFIRNAYELLNALGNIKTKS